MAETAIAIGLGGILGSNVYSSISSSRAQDKANDLQAQALAMQAEELKRQREMEADNLRRENLKQMNSIKGLTQTGYAPVITAGQDKYGDLG